MGRGINGSKERKKGRGGINNDEAWSAKNVKKIKYAKIFANKTKTWEIFCKGISRASSTDWGNR